MQSKRKLSNISGHVGIHIYIYIICVMYVYVWDHTGVMEKNMQTAV